MTAMGSGSRSPDGSSTSRPTRWTGG